MHRNQQYRRDAYTQSRDWTKCFTAIADADVLDEGGTFGKEQDAPTRRGMGRVLAASNEDCRSDLLMRHEGLRAYMFASTRGPDLYPTQGY